MWIERNRNQGAGYRKQRMRVRASDLPPLQRHARLTCAGCGEALGVDRLFVQHYRFFHLPCWQGAFPDLAAKDRETRGEP